MKVFLNSIGKVKDFVKIAGSFEESIDLCSGRYVIDAKSIMGIFSLDLSKPVELITSADNAEEIYAAFAEFKA